ncbi:alpha/beta hydrolase [endosymbiont 'TC1' of Trimyema compressum]|uniref:alpha/beta hydrolase n=1 Tax=endosymbiont 'TC1' of Trimyema compressum TaxID=243899 RepID=UPI000B4D8EBD|nr:alpha/beta hydrolase-fold protein [endosymbiont 'TC1' of Trimyema compressum]
MDTSIAVFIPDGLHRDKPYQITYLLHGLKGNHNNWADYTLLPLYALDYQSIFVMPAVSRSFYTDMVYGQKFFSYVADELPEVCKHRYLIYLQKEKIQGLLALLWGAYGALKIALTKPENYGFCGAISAAGLFLKEGLIFQRENESQVIEGFGEQINNDFKSIFGPRLEWKPEYEILELAKKINEAKCKPRIYMSCGTEDVVYYKDNSRFKDQIEKFDFDFTYEEWAGEHNLHFFNEALKKTLDVYFK